MAIPGSDNILGANSAPNQEVNLGSVVNQILSITETNPQIASSYRAESYGGVDKPGGSGSATAIKGTDSLFNPFYVFRYSKYGAIDGKIYSPEYHRDINMNFENYILGSNADSLLKGALSLIQADKGSTANPTASRIIDWARNRAGDNNADTALAATPYQLNDFLWCKWYGKIPNNRLLTLRRYPIPVEDNLQVADSKSPLIPIAQAVTWWGGESGNQLDNVLGIKYGFNWKELSADIKDVTGNEVQAESLLDAAGLTKELAPNLRKVLLATLFDNPANPYAATGYDAKIQQWIKDSYGSEGQYWNRIQGPINVINSTQIRRRGFTYEHPISLDFTYKLRTFNNVNPKIAMLDLISNFLSLTHNKAEFWGGGIRYFQKTGFILPGLPSQKFEEGDFIGGIRDVISYAIGQIQSKGGELAKLIDDLSKNVKSGDISKAADTLASSQGAQNLAGSWVSDLMQTPLKMRSYLDGRAVGEWHLTVGNPMHPVAVIGNLCLNNTKIKFGEALGLDDFPTEITFKVTLSHGRPRAKQDIESMFNLGGGSMFFTALPQPSSAYNSYGEKNSIAINTAKNGSSTASAETKSDANFKEKSSQVGVTQVNFDNIAGDDTVGNRTGISASSATKLANYFRVNVARAYGERFAKSNSLTDYFRDLKTKD
jgi:hypothetical protein